MAMASHSQLLRNNNNIVHSIIPQHVRECSMRVRRKTKQSCCTPKIQQVTLVVLFAVFELVHVQYKTTHKVPQRLRRGPPREKWIADNALPFVSIDEMKNTCGCVHPFSHLRAHKTCANSFHLLLLHNNLLY